MKDINSLHIQSGDVNIILCLQRNIEGKLYTGSIRKQ